MKIVFVTLLTMMIFFNTYAKNDLLVTVNYVDLDRYVGDWYEIARYDNSFQKGCFATKANYSKKENGDIKVVNQCRIDSPTGELKRSEGVAWVVDPDSNSKLKVQFFLTWIKLSLFAGDYWIIELDQDNYSYAMVGTENREYLWILSRERGISESLYNDLLQRAQDHGFDPSKLIKRQF